MNLRELLRLSFNSLRANKLRSALTMLGVIIGVFAVILLVSIGTGLKTYITEQIQELGSNLLFVIPGRVGGQRTPGGTQTNKLTINDAKNLDNKLHTIANIGPIIQKTATLKYTNKTDKFVSILGTTANYPEIISQVKLSSGTFFSIPQEKAGSRVAVVGSTVVTNLFPGTNPIGQKTSIAGDKYIIIGVMTKRGSLFGIDEDNSAIIPVSAAQHQFGINNVNTIYLSAKKPEFVALVKEQAKKTLLKHLTEDDFSIETQESALSTITSIINVLTIALGGIAAISLIVGGIGVMNIMLVSVTERTKEIGLRKALGARRNDILKQFLFEAIALSIAGGLIGIMLGVLASYILAIFFISVVTPWSILLAFSFSLAVGIIFGMAPAIRAARLSPIEALRYE